MTKLQRLTAATAAGTARIVPTILCGGAGTRLWPLSREAQPKPMQRLTGAETMLQATAARTVRPDLFRAPLIIAGVQHAAEIEAQLAAIGVVPAGLILEPEGRNTAPAIAAAVLEAEADDLLLVMPSDHVIGDAAVFLAAVETAVPLAEQGWLVTFGIRPNRGETGYGYIRRGEEIVPGIFRAERFVEKPDAATAQALAGDGRHDWNAGIFLFRAGAMRAALAKHAPDIVGHVEAARLGGRRHGTCLRLDAPAFGATRAQSIDHAVMEKAERIAVVPVDMAWSDVGSWDALHALGQVDSAGNVGFGDVLRLDTHGCLVRSEGPLVVTIGVENLIIIASGDAVLVVRRGESQRVKEAVELLKAQRHPAAS